MGFGDMSTASKDLRRSIGGGLKFTAVGVSNVFMLIVEEV